MFRSKFLGPALSSGRALSFGRAMVVLRCTRKLLRWLREKPVEDAAASSTLLGDWYANLLWVYRKPLILAVSARTLLPVLIPARSRVAGAASRRSSCGDSGSARDFPRTRFGVSSSRWRRSRWRQRAAGRFLGR